jgi:hypothetical protein
MVVAVSDDQPRNSLDNLRKHRKLVGVGRGYRDAADHPRPTNPYVNAKAIEGLFEERVFAESGLSFKVNTKRREVFCLAQVLNATCTSG